MDETLALPAAADGGDGDKDLTLASAWDKFREWAGQPATRGFAIGATSAALAVACVILRKRPPTPF